MVVGLMDRLVPKRTHAHGCDAKAHGLRIRRLIVGCGVQDSRDSFFFDFAGIEPLLHELCNVSL